MLEIKLSGNRQNICYNGTHTRGKKMCVIPEISGNMTTEKNEIYI